MASWRSGAWSSASPPFPFWLVPAVAVRTYVRAGRFDGKTTLSGFCGRGPSGIREGGACVGVARRSPRPLLRLGRSDRARAGVCRQRGARGRGTPVRRRGGSRAGIPRRTSESRPEPAATEEACRVPGPRALLAALGLARARPARPGWSRGLGGRSFRLSAVRRCWSVVVGRSGGRGGGRGRSGLCGVWLVVGAGVGCGGRVVGSWSCAVGAAVRWLAWRRVGSWRRGVVGVAACVLRRCRSCRSGGRRRGRFGLGRVPGCLCVGGVGDFVSGVFRCGSPRFALCAVSSVRVGRACASGPRLCCALGRSPPSGPSSSSSSCLRCVAIAARTR
jgi:hypothetical protein